MKTLSRIVIYSAILVLVACGDTVLEPTPSVVVENTIPGPVVHLGVSVHINDVHRATITTCDDCTPDYVKRADFFVPPILEENDVAYARGFRDGVDSVHPTTLPGDTVTITANNALEGTFRDLYDFVCSSGDTDRLAALAHEWGEVTDLLVQRTGSGPLPLACRHVQ